MAGSPYIISLSAHLPAGAIGNKAASLVYLEKHGCRIPRSFVVTAGTALDYVADPASTLDRLRKEVSRLKEGFYAVRSSTSIEDSRNHSFAGQFQTLINVKGTDAILNAVIQVWQSAGLPESSEYRSRVTDAEEVPACAVIIQEMVRPVLSGVSFSRNPVTNLNEIVVEAVEGLGEDLVQKGLTPLRWRIKGEFLLEGDEGFPMFQVIRDVAKATKKLRKSFQDDVDIEWAYDGKNLYYLQLRFITALGKIPVYSNRMAREMLPGQIKPLVWSVNIPMVNGTWIDLLSEITGPLDLQPEDLAKSFYYRTYFNMAALGEVFSKFGLPVESLEFMFLSEQGKMPKMMPGFKTFRHTFRMIRFAHSKLVFEPTFLKRYPILKERIERIGNRLHPDFPLSEYKVLFDELFAEGKKAAYLNIVVPILMQMHNKRLRKKLKKLGFDYDQIDFARDFPALDEMTPVNRMAALRHVFEKLPESVKTGSDSYRELCLHPDSSAFQDEFSRFMSDFGHLSESGNDFSAIKWEEDPEFVFNMIIRGGESAKNKELKSFSELSIPWLKRAGLRRLYQKAGNYRVYREQISSLYIHGYGLFRSFFLRVGRDFTDRRIIEQPSDIFLLTLDEINGIIEGSGPTTGVDYSRLAAGREKEMDDVRDLLLPPVIYGDTAPLLEKGNLRNLPGIGASPGVFTGFVRVVTGAADFGKVVRGEVLAIPFSDVSWSPVLVKAGAIVSEAGGMLSHCSIIARELGIPALVSVENACMLDNGLSVTVDGSNGILTINQYE